MIVYWTCKEEDLRKIPSDIDCSLEHDWLLDEG
jgi:hypothetical protein